MPATMKNTSEPSALSQPPPPPGAPSGGVWGKNTYRGGKTMAMAGVGCLCFCLPGLLLLIFPIDSQDAYMDPSGKVR